MTCAPDSTSIAGGSSAEEPHIHIDPRTYTHMQSSVWQREKRFTCAPDSIIMAGGSSAGEPPRATMEYVVTRDLPSSVCMCACMYVLHTDTF